MQINSFQHNSYGLTWRETISYYVLLDIMSSKRQAMRNRDHVAQIDGGLAIVVNVIRNLSIHSLFC